MKHLKRASLAGAALAAGLAAATPALAEGGAHDAAIAARKAHMQLLKWELTTLGAMAKGAIPYDAEKAASAANDLKALAGLDLHNAWPEESDSDMNQNTRALPKIWENMEDFGKKYGALQAATEAMAAAAGKDLDSLKAAMGNVGGACKACHKEYRKPKDG